MAVTNVFNDLFGKNAKNLGEVSFKGTIGHRAAEFLAEEVGKIIKADMKVPFCFAGGEASKSYAYYSLAEDKTTLTIGYQPCSLSQRFNFKAKEVRCMYAANKDISAKEIKIAAKQARKIAKLMDIAFNYSSGKNMVLLITGDKELAVNAKTNVGVALKNRAQETIIQLPEKFKKSPQSNF